MPGPAGPRRGRSLIRSRRNGACWHSRETDSTGRLIYAMAVSLDGFVETRDRSLEWVRVDEEFHRVFNDMARAVSAFVYGRRCTS